MVKKTSKQRRQETKEKGPSKYRSADKNKGRRFLFIWLPIITVIIIFFYALVFDPPRPFGQPIPGTSRASEQTRPGESTVKTYIVDLDDGRMVELDGLQMGLLEAGRRVLVQERISLIFKRKSFSFVRYLEENNKSLSVQVSEYVDGGKPDILSVLSAKFDVYLKQTAVHSDLAKSKVKCKRKRAF
ncbi:MAG TPA: hypothetical protein VMT12_13570 [Syntrophales bacterium]|nr:hypothetical protein [Syntrophales bacterium]